MKLFVGALFMTAALAVAAPAWAHDEMSPATVPTGRAVFLTLTSANERSSDLISVTITAPDGISLGPATRQSPGWTAERSSTAITWTGGTVVPDTFDQWGFEVEEVGQPGALRWSVATGYADGESDTHEVEVVAVTPGSEPTTPATEPTVATTAVSAPTTVVTATTTSSGNGGSDSRATAALVIGGLAAVLAVVALVVAVRGRRRTAGPAVPAGPVGPAGPTPTAGMAQPPAGKAQPPAGKAQPPAGKVPPPARKARKAPPPGATATVDEGEDW